MKSVKSTVWGHNEGGDGSAEETQQSDGEESSYWLHGFKELVQVVVHVGPW